jgi:hypothetical protein
MNSSGYQEMKKFPEEDDTQVNRKTFMLTIVWNSGGFHLTKALGKGRKFTTGYYIAKVLEPLSQWRSIEAAGNERKLLVHADNTCPQTANSIF